MQSLLVLVILRQERDVFQSAQEEWRLSQGLWQAETVGSMGVWLLRL